MKNDKFCVSKTLSYLVALVVAVVGAFYVMNYANNQKLANPEAAGKKCRTETGITGIWRQSACPVSGYVEYTGPGGTYQYTSNGATKTMYCCLSAYSTGGTNYTTNADRQAGITAADCTSKKNIIKEMKGLRCMYYTGNYTVSKGQVTCDVKSNDSYIACSAGVGKALKVAGDVVKTTCAGLKDTVVPGTVELGASTKHYVCRVYTGGYRTSTNPSATAVSGNDYTSMCLTDYRRDYNVGTFSTPSYNTTNCH